MDSIETLQRINAPPAMGGLATSSTFDLARLWRLHIDGRVPNHLPKVILIRILAYKLQEQQQSPLLKQAIAYLKTLEAILRLGKVAPASCAS